MTAGEALVWITLAFCVGVVFGGCINAAVRRQRRRRESVGHPTDSDRAGRPLKARDLDRGRWIEHG
jgi:hypothetical protein